MVWFRRDLTLSDNFAWSQATSEFAEVHCVFVVENRLIDSAGPFRRAQLLASLNSLRDEIRALGGELHLLRGPASLAIPHIAHELGAAAVLFNANVTRFARERDRGVVEMLDAAGVKAVPSWGTLVHPPGSIVTAAGGVHKVFSRFYERWESVELMPEARRGDATLPTGSSSDWDVVDLNLLSPPPLSPGGFAALARLQGFCATVDDYVGVRDRPDLDATSHLSADLHFGTISPRVVVRTVGRSTAGRRAFVRQLAWRDWYAHLFFERPDLATRSQQPAYELVEWRNDPAEIGAWCEGRTGYPLVDAAMRELAATGWMHNRLRMIVASFLVKDLLVDWRVGERHFRRLLVDGDVAQNAGNWQWAAGTGPDAAPYFRVMNPTTQARRCDPDGDYVRRWVPELAALKGSMVHAPQDLGGRELAAADIALGVNYPYPVVDHAFARVRALAAYAAARALNSGQSLR